MDPEEIDLDAEQPEQAVNISNWVWHLLEQKRYSWWK